MRPLTILLLSLTLTAFACHNPGIAPGVPSCVFAEISRESKDAGSMIGAVKEYQYMGRMVYTFEPDTRKIADGATIIKDNNCNTLCSVGGFAGLANNQCLGGNFFKEAVYKRTIWEKK
jgi:hypothetical protein